MGKPTGLAKKQLDTLARLTQVTALDGFYLAGGTAIAFHLSHRRSLDLDLFSGTLKVDLEEVVAQLKELFPDCDLALGEATAHGHLGGVAIDLVRYRFPLLERARAGPGGFPVAGLLDLATMKIGAIARRGLRRDFWDLHVIIESGPTLPRIIRAYLRRFRVSQLERYHVVRSLTYFVDAEKDKVMPRGLTAGHWQEIKEFFRACAPSLLEAED